LLLTETFHFCLFLSIEGRRKYYSNVILAKEELEGNESVNDYWKIVMTANNVLRK